MACRACGKEHPPETVTWSERNESQQPRPYHCPQCWQTRERRTIARHSPALSGQPVSADLRAATPARGGAHYGDARHVTLLVLMGPAASGQDPDSDDGQGSLEAL